MTGGISTEDHFCKLGCMRIVRKSMLVEGKELKNILGELFVISLHRISAGRGAGFGWRKELEKGVDF